MNPVLLKTAVSTASTAWRKLQEYRAEKARQAYDALEAAAERIEDIDTSSFTEARRSAGAVTQAAHARLEDALAQLKDRGEEAKDEAGKRLATVSKKARKAATKKSRKRRAARRTWTALGVVALLAGAAAAVYYFFFEKEKPSTVPPRVEEFGADSPENTQGSRLVYTSTSESDRGSDLAEEGVVERDEELLGSLEEQLAKHRLHTEEEK